MEKMDIFCVHLEFVYILRNLFFPVLVSWTKKNLATLVESNKLNVKVSLLSEAIKIRGTARFCIAKPCEEKKGKTNQVDEKYSASAEIGGLNLRTVLLAQSLSRNNHNNSTITSKTLA
jgi:hypothetical protein